MQYLINKMAHVGCLDHTVVVSDDWTSMLSEMRGYLYRILCKRCAFK